jgi:hypothetical protein
MKKTYGKILALATQLTVLILSLREGIITSPESMLDFYLAVMFITFLFLGIIWVLFLIAEDIIRNNKNKY